jgi:hypothetical protein
MPDPLYDNPRSPSFEPPPQTPNLLNQAQETFPLLKKYDIDYVETPQQGKGYLEFWPGDEEGTKDYPRPDSLKKGKPGLQVFDPSTRPIDVAGDIVSHHLINEDKTIKKHYADFKDSLTDDQKDRLKEQYQHAKDNEGETRSYKKWEEHSGLPAYFRGYAFQQWTKGRDDPAAAELYTPEQLDKFDDMLKYLKKK